MDANDIQIRTGINSSELCGRTWKTVEALKRQLHHSSSVSSLDSMSNISQRGFSESTCTSDSISLDSRSASFRKISAESSGSCPVLNKGSEGSFLTNTSGSTENLVRNGSGTALNDIFERSVDDRTLSYCNIEGDSLSIDVPDMMWHSPMDAIGDHSNRENLWTWISASGCAVDSESLPNWFCEGNKILYITCLYNILIF